MGASPSKREFDDEVHTSNEQQQFIKQYMEERALMIALKDSKAVVYDSAGRSRSASGVEDGKLPAIFKWPSTGAKDVYVSGSWDNWKTKTQLHKSGTESEYLTIIELGEGDHQYKFWVDGQWKTNPDEPSVLSETGTLNNVVRVKRSDFEVMEALEQDAESKEKQKRGNEKAGEWGQEPASHKPHSAPPQLPSALLKGMLNQPTSAHLEPSLLPEPNHVMLNHLYALSIKDGVMVLSSTHRFRKKYVTTLLYKPIEESQQSSD